MLHPFLLPNKFFYAIFVKCIKQDTELHSLENKLKILFGLGFWVVGLAFFWLNFSLESLLQFWLCLPH